jgi:tetratricopeptide (TPR) repeat protein
MKPRAFIGSSVEGLPIAYAVQQNLLHDAEITVWSQGVFDLSATTIESLDLALSGTDFGIFVFSKDDALLFRNEQVSVVRDNVLFEFGLFIGRIGRDRVFFIVPDDVNSVRIPTDLLGVTPGKYETNRTDGNMQSATGPVCHQIRTKIQTLGSHPSRSSPPDLPETLATVENEERHWIFEYMDGKYVEARKLIEAELLTATGDDAVKKQVWALRCDLKLDEEKGLQGLLDYATSGKTAAAICAVAEVLLWEKLPDKALDLISTVSSTIANEPNVQVAVANCHLANAEPDKALNALNDTTNHPEVALKKAEILETSGRNLDALACIYQCYTTHSKNEGIRYQFARLAQECNKYDVAAYLYAGLTKEFPTNVTYWGYLGNTLTSLNLLDRALISYQKAAEAELDREPQQWILSNIGNLLNNKDLPSEACKYLQRAIKQSPSDYAYERLAMAMKKVDLEYKEFEKKCLSGLKEIRAMAVVSETAAI